LYASSRHGLARRDRRFDISAMSRDDAADFRPRIGRIRDHGRASVRRSQSFVAEVMKAAAKANGGPLTHAQFTGGKPRERGSGKGRCSRIGRGQAVADRLKRQAAERSPGQRQRRVVVKARIVRHRIGSGAAGAHLRYIQRDGTTRDGERGQLYSPEHDQEDGRAFVERGESDRHSFRMIVAPEDGDRLSDLRGFTRDVMAQMEADLGTKFDWVAVDHHNTGHPHSHVVIRGKDDLGKDLVIAQDYITDGVRLRAQERATLELGPETDLELREKLRAEITAERFTRIDRAMIEEAPERVLDLRPEAGQVRADFDRTLRVGRLQALERYGLAREHEPSVWTISEKLEPAMRTLGERGDIVKAINRALTDRGLERGMGQYVLHGEEERQPVIGRVIGKRLTDELGDRVALIVDGVDGRTHHVALGDKAVAQDAPIGSIVEIGRAPAGSRASDRNIAALAEETGIYCPSEHRAIAEAGHVRVPGGDYDGYVGSHVRRLEALRRAGVVERLDADRWSIPSDYETRAATYDATQSRRMNLRVLSAYDLDKQITSDGATWLDRELVSPNRMPLTQAGFGAEVSRALEQRKDSLVDQGLASRTPEGGVRAPRDLLSRLEQQEIARVGPEMAKARGLTFKPAEAGNYVSGTLAGAVNLGSGKFAMIDDGLGFSLVPWQPVLEQRLGRQVTGIAMPGGGIDWTFGRSRGLGL
jgi:type IV secretory pathway VirD2 relaxase